jgi:hypothetical protein
MTVDQMLWHVNQFLAAALGEISLPEQKIAMPPFLLRFILLRMPWPKSAPTNSGAIASRAYDFAVEHHRCRELIDRLVRRPLEGEWNVNPVLGAVNGRFVSALQAKHLDHHLRQFGV